MSVLTGEKLRELFQGSKVDLINLNQHYRLLKLKTKITTNLRKFLKGS